MTQQTIVALFRSKEDAGSAQRQLEAAGIPGSDIKLRDGPVETAAATRDDTGEQRHGFLDWLFGAEPAAEDVERYRAHAAQGGAALSVRADERDMDRISALLEQQDLVAIEEAREFDTGSSASATTSGGSAQSAKKAGAGAATEEVALPTAREELEVGKRQVSDTRSYRVRRYVVQRPVEAQVTLHDERVEVERRTAAGRQGDGQPFEEKSIEVTETREEPVVSKRVVPGEEVVVRKTGGDRVETVRDTVRESRVEVGKEAAGDKPASPSRPPTGGSR